MKNYKNALIIHGGATRISKRYNAENFSKLIEMFYKKIKVPIILIGSNSKEDIDFANKMKAKLGDIIKEDFTAKLSIRELMAIIKNSNSKPSRFISSWISNPRLYPLVPALSGIPAVKKYNFSIYLNSSPIFGLTIRIKSFESPIKKLPNCKTVGAIKPLEVAIKNFSSSIFATEPAGCGIQKAS